MISANMVVWNEEDTIGLAIRSVKDLVDEIIIVDNMSTDNTVKVARRTCDMYDLNYTIIPQDGGIIWDSRKTAIENSEGDWILVVDGDHFYHEKLHWIIKDICKSDEPRCYLFRYYQLYGDLLHFMKDEEISPPHVSLFYNNHQVKAPKYRRSLPEFDYPETVYKDIIGFNLTGYKSIRRLFVRWFYVQWQEEYPHYKNVVEYIENERPLIDIDKDSKRLMLNNFIDKSTPITDLSILPEILREESKHPKYELLYNGNKIIGRRPDLL